ncbi:hypothetical protein JTE90_000208 [Oedothorax gibbosus]|uniref:Shugoshin C-terminal domain-containing protein n=1 Tax=Oedothorax gibbosus TaxID=931172 RepID=A0AAV6VA92_9ARAC|nr:hypothetical protein JTE90_000208 [Oedothorax gibbosus]
MGDSAALDWTTTMGHRKELEDGKKEASSDKDAGKTCSQPIRKNRSEVLLAVRDEFGVVTSNDSNRPHSEALIKNKIMACVSIEIDPATDDEECHKNGVLNNNESPEDDPKSPPLTKQKNVKEDAERNGALSFGTPPNRKRILQKQPCVELASPVDKPPEDRPARSVKGKLASLLSTGRKKPVKSYSCPHEDDEELLPKRVKRQCMSLDTGDSKCPPSTLDYPDNNCPPVVRHRPFGLKSSLKGESMDSASKNHVQATPLHSPRKPGVKLVIDDMDCVSTKERRSVAYSRKNSLMPQVSSL